jgi:hypothetical protein
VANNAIAIAAEQQLLSAARATKAGRWADGRSNHAAAAGYYAAAARHLANAEAMAGVVTDPAERAALQGALQPVRATWAATAGVLMDVDPRKRGAAILREGQRQASPWNLAQANANSVKNAARFYSIVQAPREGQLGREMAAVSGLQGLANASRASALGALGIATADTCRFGAIRRGNTIVCATAAGGTGSAGATSAAGGSPMTSGMGLRPFSPPPQEQSYALPPTRVPAPQQRPERRLVVQAQAPTRRRRKSAGAAPAAPAGRLIPLPGPVSATPVPVASFPQSSAGGSVSPGMPIGTGFGVAPSGSVVPVDSAAGAVSTNDGSAFSLLGLVRNIPGWMLIALAAGGAYVVARQRRAEAEKK